MTGRSAWKFLGVIAMLLASLAGGLAVGDFLYSEDPATNRAFVDTPQGYVDTPLYITSSGFYDFNIRSKTYTGDFNLLFGIDSDTVKISDAYGSITKNVTTQHSRTCDRNHPTTYATWSSADKWVSCWRVGNETDFKLWNQTFDSFNTITDTIYWSTTEEKTISKAAGSFINSLDGFSFDGKNRWYYMQNVPITAGQTITLSAYFTVPIGDFAKYDLALFPATYPATKEGARQAVRDGNFIFIDPFVTSTFYEIGNVTNNTNKWHTDMNATASTVSLSTDNETFTLGTVSNTITSDEAKVWFDMKDGSGTFVTDESGESNHGATVGGPGWVGANVVNTVPFEYSLDFTPQDYISIPFNQTSFNGSNPIVAGTVSMWFYNDALGTEYLFYQWAGAAKGILMYVDNSGGNARFNFQVGDGTNAATRNWVAPSSEVGTWNHIVVTWGGQHRAIYYNGTRQTFAGGGTLATGSNLGNSKLAVGASSVPSFGWDGHINQFILLDRNITIDEVNELYRAGNAYNHTEFFGYNTSENTYVSNRIPVSFTAASFTPAWMHTLNGGTFTINATCDSTAATPTWTGNLTNASSTNCGAAGASFQYIIDLTGTSTASPTVKMFNATFVEQTTNLNLTTAYNESFTGSCPGWSGWTCNTTGNYYESTTDADFATSPDLNLSSYSYYEFCFRGYSTSDHNNTKWYFSTNQSQTNGDHWIGDTSGGSFRFRPEPGYSPSLTTTFDVNHAYCMKINNTGNTMELTIDGANLTRNTANITNSSAQDYVRMTTGSMGGGYFWIDNVTLQVLADEYPPVDDDTIPDSTATFTSFSFEAINGSGSVLGDQRAFNTSNLVSFEKMRFNFTVTDDDNVSDVFVFFTANGTGGCSLGNRQSAACYNYTNNNWIHFRNNSLTATYDGTLASGGNQGDKINCTATGNRTNKSFSCVIDEHYNPNVFKHYNAQYNFSDVKYQTGASQRLTQNNLIRVSLDQTLIPLGADQYKLDLRVQPSTPAPTTTLDAYLCNSTYTTGDPTVTNNCAVVAQKTANELSDDGTKYRVVFTQTLIDQLGDLRWLVLVHDQGNPNRYYSIKTYAIRNGGHTQQWNYSTDSGTTWTNSGDGYETEANINWFYAGVKPTGIVMKVGNNDSREYTVNSSIKSASWNIDATENYNPLVVITTPADNASADSIIDFPYTVVFNTSDPNDDNMNVSYYLDTVQTKTSMNESNTSVTITSLSLGAHTITIEACELGTTDLYCVNTSRSLQVVQTDCSAAIKTGALNSSLEGWGSETRCNNYETLFHAHSFSGNVTKTFTNSTASLLYTPWYTASNVCQESNLKTTCGANGTRSDFCVVSDEFSQYALSLSMSQNRTYNQTANQTYNTIRALNASSHGYGQLVEWDVRVTNVSGTMTLNKSVVSDTASDADARIILALRNFNTSDTFSALDQGEIGTYLRQYCIDFLSNNFVSTTKTSLVNASKTMNWLPAGGSAVAASGITANDFMYTGYYGDMTLALLACAAHTNNGTYFKAANHTVESYFAAANWTPSSVNVTFPPGRAFKWSSDATPIASCTTLCSPEPYVDDPDGKRFTTLCAADYLANKTFGQQIHPWLDNYCYELSNHTAITNTTWVVNWWSNNVSNQTKSDATDSYSANALAMSIELNANKSQLEDRYIHIGTKWQATDTFDSTACHGLYEPSFALQGYGYSLGFLDVAVSNTTTLDAPITSSISVNNIQFRNPPVRSDDDPVCQGNSTYTGSATNLTYTYTWYVNDVLNFSATISQPKNILRNLSTFNGQNLTKNHNITCQVSATDGTITSSDVNVSTNISNAIPRLLSTIITKAGDTLTCLYTYDDNDNDSITYSSYRWFRNGAFSSTGQTRDVSLDVPGTQYICEATIGDGTNNGTPLNSTTFTTGDTVPPVLGDLQFNNPAVVNTVNNLSVSCTDDQGLQNLFPALTFVDPNGIVYSRLNMSSDSRADFWERNYTPNVAGEWTVNVECLDTGGNLVNKLYAWSVVTSGTGGSGGGGGGGSGTAAQCGFEVVQPLSEGGVTFFGCTPETERTAIIRIESLANFNKELSASIDGVDCEIQPTLDLAAKQTKGYAMTCVCPEHDVTETGSIEISEESCAVQANIPVTITGNTWGRLFDSPIKIAGLALAVILGVAIIGTGIRRIT